MRKVIIFAVVIICFGCNFSSKGQTYDELLELTFSGKDISERLPPLAELQEKALENSPTVQYFEAEVAVKNLQIKAEKRAWMRSMGIETGAKYGLFDNLVLTQDLDYNDLATSTTEQTRYYLGFYAKIPLSDIIDKSNIKTAIAESDKLKYLRAARIQELRELIIVRYNNVVKEYRGMVIKLNAVENYRVQQMRADEDFKNGVINVYEKARLEDMLSKSVIELEEAKLDFLTAFQVLEETVGIKIILIN
jgi:outer membrane protein TolC